MESTLPSAKTMDDAVCEFERLNMTLPQVDLRTEHVLSGGMCARTFHIPADVAVTGARHNKDAINVMHGDITVTTDEGVTRLTGYHVIPSKAGTKRAGFAHAATTWTTIWRTELTDIEAIEDEMTDESDKLQTRQSRLPATEFKELEK